MASTSTFELNQADVSKLFAQMERSSNKLGKSTKSSLQYGARLLCQSIGARTKPTKQKQRPIVRNKKKKGKSRTDGRMADFGVMGYKKGKETFIPIYRTGEFGKFRFLDKKTMAWFDRSSGSGKWVKISSGPDIANPEIIVPGIKTDKRRKIPHRNLAKKTWGKAKTMITRGGVVSVLGVRNLATVAIETEGRSTSITITNRVRHATDALEGGSGAISASFAAAASKMEHNLTKAIAKKMGAK